MLFRVTMCHYQPPENNHSVSQTCWGHLLFISNGLRWVWVAVFTSVTGTRLESQDWHHYHLWHYRWECMICDISVTPKASFLTSLLLQRLHLWQHYYSKCIVCDVIIAPNTYLWHHYHSKHIICDIIIALTAWSVTSISLQTHHLWHHYCSKTSSVTSLSLQMHHLWHHYLSECIICDIIISLNAWSVTSLLLQTHHLWHYFLQTHHLWHHYHSERIICDIIITLNASSVCLTSRPPPGFWTADDIQQNMSCAQPSSGVKLSTARICPRNTHAPQCKRTTLRPAQKFPPV